jgi:hypothetical protein
MTIFLVFNGLGVAFLLYVLGNFWIEGHRQRNNDQKYARRVNRPEWADVLVATHALSRNAQGGLSVIPFRSPTPSGDVLGYRTTPRETPEIPVRRISTR